MIATKVTFTVGMEILPPLDRKKAESYVRLLIEMVTQHIPEVAPDIRGFLLLPDMNQLYITLATRGSAETCEAFLNDVADGGQLLRRVAHGRR